METAISMIPIHSNVFFLGFERIKITQIFNILHDSRDTRQNIWKLKNGQIWRGKLTRKVKKNIENSLLFYNRKSLSTKTVIDT